MAAEALTLEDVVCPFCSLACDDLAVTRTERGGVALIGPECPLARTGYIDSGTVQTTLSEMRNRADLVLVFGPDPRRIAPRLFERTLPASGLFLSPEAQREIVFLAGQPEAEFADHCRVDVIPAPSQRIGELAGALLLAFTKGSLPRPVFAGIPAGRLTELAQRMRQAQYGVVVFAPGLIDQGESDLAIGAVLHLVQELNRVNRWSA